MCIRDSIYDIIINGLYFDLSGEGSNVAYLNTTHSHKIIGSYLMQIKFTLNCKDISTIKSTWALTKTLDEVKEKNKSWLEIHTNSTNTNDLDKADEPIQVDFTEGSEFTQLYKNKLTECGDIDIIALWSYQNNQSRYTIFYTKSSKCEVDKMLELHHQLKSLEGYKENEHYCSFTFGSIIGVRPKLW